MSKTQLTLDLEKTLYAYWEEQGAVAVEEVSLPEDAGIVDTLVLQTDGAEHTWRCFELKVTKSDFHSDAKLYPQVQAEIPAHIGVMTYRAFDAAALAASLVPVTVPGALTIVRPARHQELQISDSQLMAHFVSSLNREVQKAKRVEKGLAQYSDEQLLKELRKRSGDYDIYHPDNNLYDQFVAEVTDTTTAALQEEVDALTGELALLKLGLTGKEQS
ncbi:hypothetical protein [Lacticaseibacillus hulanensis]|uniref:hypothetical protein n=1 Tax=Lacticaseibacillus hulanensis TaxID=2493111 RepID=UPI000FDB615C|nr:hypothetical protein [Lacticaseibacillus hulanensis]